MERARRGDVLVIRFADGDDFLQELKRALSEEGLTSGIILGGVGMLKRPSLSFYRGEGRYDTMSVDHDVELLALNGNVARADGDIIVHAHATVSRDDGAALGGHLAGGRVHMTAEVAVLATGHSLTRRLDPATGLKTLRFE